jgi:hypothetical protein
MTPAEEDRPAGAEAKPAVRRKVQLVEPAEAKPERASVPAPRAEVHIARKADRVLRVAELVVGDWAPTLREALVRVLVYGILVACLGIVLGAEVAVLAATVGFVMFLVGRRRAGSTG